MDSQSQQTVGSVPAEPSTSTNEDSGSQISDHDENVCATPRKSEDDFVVSSDSSKLSSLASDLLSTPVAFTDDGDTPESNVVGATRAGSPLRRSQRKRTQPSHLVHSESTKAEPKTKKRRKLDDNSGLLRSGSSTAIASPRTPVPASYASRSPAQDSGSSSQSTLFSSPATDTYTDVAVHKYSSHDSPLTIDHDSIVHESNCRGESLPRSGLPRHSNELTFTAVEADIITSFFGKIKNKPQQRNFTEEVVDQVLGTMQPPQGATERLSHEEWKSDTMYPGFDRRNPRFYNSDGYTKAASSNAAEPNSTQGSEAPSPSRKTARSNGGKRSQTQKGKPKGRASGGGAGGGRDRDRDRDSPEPPNRTALSQDDKATLANIRARQAELKKLFTAVGGQQRDALEILVTRDLSKMTRKPRAHQKVPEYEELLEDLREEEEKVRRTVRAESDMRVALLMQNLRAEKYIIEAQFNLRVAEAQKEHIKGAKGDLAIFMNAHRAAKDGTWTEHGSDVESYFPRYHELPEPDGRVRGYTSSRISDEKPFQENLMKYDEEARRDVIEDDILEPVRQSVVRQNVKRQTEAEEKSKQRMDELAVIAVEELGKASGYLIPRPLQGSENPQFALSRLADCADYIAKMHPEKSYMFMPVAPRDIPDFPHRFLERIPPPPVETDTAPDQTEPSSKSPSRRVMPKKQKPLWQHSRQPSKAEESPSQSSSSTSTPLAPSLPMIAPAPTRMPPPPASMQQHHRQLSQHQIPSLVSGSLPPPMTTLLQRPPPLTPLIIPKPHASSPETPVYGPPRLLPNQIPPPPSPGGFRPLPSPQQFGPPLAQPPLQRFPDQYPRPTYPPPPSYQEQPSRAPGAGRPPPPSPGDPTPTMQSQQNRFLVPGYGQPRTPRPAGSRRNSGQITFTPAYTPSSARFKPIPSPLTGAGTPTTSNPTPHLSTWAAQQPKPTPPPPQQHEQEQEQQQTQASTDSGVPPPPPGQSQRPPQPQPQPQSQNSNGEMGRSTNPGTGAAGKVTKEFTHPQVDSKTLADTARQNAARAQGQGAGPKGGKRVLLPKAG